MATVFIDGTKIEANANRYSFVWKKSTEKNLAKLKVQIGKNTRERRTPAVLPGCFPHLALIPSLLASSFPQKPTKLRGVASQ